MPEGHQNNETQYELDTRLSNVAAAGLSHLVDDLLSKGANPNKTDLNGITPLGFAIQQKRSKVINLLLEVSDVNIGCPLHKTVLHGDLETTKKLLARGVNPNKADSNGHTPLQNIRINSPEELDKDIAILMLKCGADLNAEDKKFLEEKLGPDMPNTIASKEFGGIARLWRMEDPENPGHPVKTPMELVEPTAAKAHQDAVYEFLLCGLADSSRNNSDNPLSLLPAEVILPIAQEANKPEHRAAYLQAALDKATTKVLGK